MDTIVYERHGSRTPGRARTRLTRRPESLPSWLSGGVGYRLPGFAICPMSSAIPRQFSRSPAHYLPSSRASCKTRSPDAFVRPVPPHPSLPQEEAAPQSGSRTSGARRICRRAADGSPRSCPQERGRGEGDWPPQTPNGRTFAIAFPICNSQFSICNSSNS
jgi:hypothetical protein